MTGDPLLILQGLLLVPAVVGSVYALLRLPAIAAFQRRPRAAGLLPWPPVSVLKPICGLDKELEENLRSMCDQDYPDYQVVLSVQTPDDPALPLLHRLEAEFGSERVSVAVARGEPSANGKIFNLLNALSEARHEVLVISDSDVRVPADFLKAIVPPLSEPQVGYACTIYRGVRAERWFERLEALSLHDFTADVIFSDVTGASKWCMGSSIAFRRSILKEIGGLEPLAQHLVEDFEMGRRIHAKGFEAVLVPYMVDTVVDLGSTREWWNHQLYWDLNTRMARLGGFLAQVVIRSVPFALLFAAARLFDLVGLGVLAGALAVRLGATATTLRMLDDREGLRSLFWIPVRDVAGLAIWMLALVRRTVVWRGVTYRLTRDGRMVPVR